MIRTLRKLVGHRLARDCRGAAAVEFAFVAPALFLLAVGTAQFGLVLSNYIMLAEGVSTGARMFAVSRGSATPYSGTVTAIQNAAPSLTPGNITITMTVNGTACNSNATCQTALASAAGQPARVTATYPCELLQNVFGYNFAPGCTLSVATTERIE